MASIYDVARLAGVSKTLVSRVINGQKGVGEGSRKRIEQAMKELNYKPNAIARSLVLQKTGIIGVILDDLCDPFLFDFIKGIEKEIEKSNCEVIFCGARNKIELKKKYIDFFSQGRADGYILYGSNVNDQKVTDDLELSTIPVVLVENDVAGMNINNVCVDNRFGSELAVNYLIKQGCLSIYHVTGDMNIKAAIHRKEGYEAAMQKHGFAVKGDMIIEAGFTIDSGYQAVANMLEEQKGEKLPDAIYFGSDATALGGMMAMEDRGIRVPEDIKVVGFDNDAITVPDRNLKKLTTVSQPIFDMGASAVRLLMEDISEGLTEKKRIVFYPELVIRETT